MRKKKFSGDFQLFLFNILLVIYAPAIRIRVKESLSQKLVIGEQVNNTVDLKNTCLKFSLASKPNLTSGGGGGWHLVQ
jgi:hypothetical protein